MKIQTNKGTFNVRWRYGAAGVSLKKNNETVVVERNVTTCDIRLGHPATEAELAEKPEVKTVYQTIASGNAIVHPTDTFDKVVGRQLAFRKAISQLPREDRKPLWDVFRKEVKQ